jgi:hypothetical protein
MQQQGDWRSSTLLPHSFIYRSNWLSTARPTSVHQFRLDMTGQEVESNCNLGATHYDPIEKVGVMVIVV